MSYREDDLRGKILMQSTFSPPTITGKFRKFEFPVATTIVEILDEAGTDVKTTYIKGSLTVVAGAEIVVLVEGGFFTSITTSSGTVLATNA